MPSGPPIWPTVRDQLLRADDEDDVGCAPGEGGELGLPGAEAITRVPSRVTACTLPRT
ncbi:MAG TPA: hypothetical protein VIX86_19670 [Streptosporangiaceae bacterium]